MASELLPVANDLEFEATIRRLEVTQQVFERYKLLRVLGRGGMGVVWLAHDERLDRDVALKFLPDEISLDPEAEDEMKRETRRCLDLTHPNIIRIYDFVKDRQAAAISMEYIDGQTLAALKLQKPQRMFDVDELRPWITHACQALGYAHAEAGVIHRDLKPANLMLTSRGQIKIADFGIAHTLTDSMARMTMRRGTSGTLAYMSPQQMGGERAAQTDDVYALGASIYELLTSKPPFHSGNVSFQVRVMIAPSMRERRDELEIRAGEIPKEWEDAIAACLSKMPEERPATMHDLAERLGLVAAKAPLPKTPKPKEKLPAAAKTSAVPRSLPRLVIPAWLRSPRVLGGVAGAVVVGAGIAIACRFVSSAPVARGEIDVASNPPAALVHLDGRTDVRTPAKLTGFAKGRYSLTISADGYDSLPQVVSIGADATVDLGTLALRRAVGQLALNTLPRQAHYVVTGADHFSKEGSTPDLLSALPTGTYSVALTRDGFRPCTKDVTVAAHSVDVENINLVQAEIAPDPTDMAMKVFRGEADARTLDDAGRTQLSALYTRAFEQYISSGLLPMAAQALSHLRDLGMDVNEDQIVLEAKRTEVETAAGNNMAALIGARKFATAGEVLKNRDGALEKESLDRLATRFAPAIVPYEAQIDASIATLQTPPPAIALPQVQKLITQYPDDLRLEVEAATLQMQLTPDLPKLAVQVNAFRTLATQNRDAASDPAVLKIRAALEAEWTQLDALSKALADAKAAVDPIKANIAHLLALKNAYEDRRIGKPDDNPFSGAANFFSKAFTGHAARTERVFTSRRQKEDTIADVQSQIDAAELTLPVPQAALDDAQKRYNDFVAAVPWGQA
jgi:hypothetical protein